MRLGFGRAESCEVLIFFSIRFSKGKLNLPEAAKSLSSKQSITSRHSASGATKPEDLSSSCSALNRRPSPSAP